VGSVKKAVKTRIYGGQPHPGSGKSLILYMTKAWEAFGSYKPPVFAFLKRLFSQMELFSPDLISPLLLFLSKMADKKN